MKNLKQWALPTAMIIGALTYPWLSQLAFSTPYLISTILVLTFTKMSPKELQFSPLHIKLLLIQILGAIALYFLIAPLNTTVAQGAMLCLLTPTATSAPAVTKMLGGNVAMLTSYLFLCNIVVAFVAPLLFSLITDNDSSIFISFITILRKVGSLLVIPLFSIWAIRFLLPKIHSQIAKFSFLSFYLWALALMIVTANTVNFFVTEKDGDHTTELLLLLSSLILSILQFQIGRKIGRKSGETITFGQTLGQKNTILGIWMGQTFLNPLSSIAMAGYVVWQNLINSFQIWQKENRNKTSK
ncbi:MAG: transporter [Rikenellaceae bacterium]